MSGRPSPLLLQAMNAVESGQKSPYAAAKEAGIALSTIYRSPRYKAWKAAQERKRDKQPSK